MTSRRHRTASGIFAVHRAATGGLTLEHVPSGLPAGQFAHISIRTFKHALAGMEDVERALCCVRDDLGAAQPSDTTLQHLQTELQRAFPNGAWSR